MDKQTLMSKNIKEYSEYEGIDADLETSLFEYGLIWKLTDGEYKFVYGVEYDADGQGYALFDYATEPADTSPKEEWDFAEWDKLYSFTGQTEAEFFAQSLPNIVSDLILYYGYQNIFGSSYQPFVIEY